jgi:hypothetical protein
VLRGKISLKWSWFLVEPICRNFTNNQRVKVYRLTAAGKKQLTAERSRWEQFSEAVAGVLNPGLIIPL